MIVSALPSGKSMSCRKVVLSMLGAWSSYLTFGKTLSIGQWSLVIMFLRGVFNKRPMFPRCQQTWDVNVVLYFLITLSPVKILSLRSLTLKLVMLLALVTGERIHTLTFVVLDFMQIKATVTAVRNS